MKIIKFIQIIIFIILLLNIFNVNLSLVDGSSIKNNEYTNSIKLDILSIRALDVIDKNSDPDFFIKIYINNFEYVSDIWYDIKYIYDSNYSINIDIPDDEFFLNITIQLWDYFDEDNEHRLCDISGDPGNDYDSYDVEIKYNIRTGHWNGDDFLTNDFINFDPSGYGRLNGCDDGTIYENQRDCEVWFDIYPLDLDGDRIPYWAEKNLYYTDPEINNIGEDFDADGVNIEWEHKWGYNPLEWEDHESIDLDNDSLSNIEEFLTSKYGSDPYRKDLFLELDYMENSPDGEISRMPITSKELMKNPFHRRNIVFFIDIGELDGGEEIPFENITNQSLLLDYYNNYFIKNETNRWVRGVFHYGIIAYKSFPAGYAFSGDVEPIWGYHAGTNSFVISSSRMERNDKFNQKNIDYFYASAIVHELGHNFGLRSGNPPGVDVQSSKWPWQIGWWIYRDYESIMNYHYTYKILDYSDGSNGGKDFNDWLNIDLSYFEYQ
jgi:hypothetical protein